MKDDYIIVLDFLPHGKSIDRKAEPVVQGLGEKYFNLLEVVVKDDIKIKMNDKVYIGEEKRDQVKYIRGRIGYSELTSFAKSSLEEAISKLINDNEKQFVNFFNVAGPITTRLHSLELLPGIGKKHMWSIVTEKRKKKFETFKELQDRVAMLPDPKKMIIKRILEELEGKDRYKLFVGSDFIYR